MIGGGVTVGKNVQQQVGGLLLLRCPQGNFQFLQEVGGRKYIVRSFHAFGVAHGFLVLHGVNQGIGNQAADNPKQIFVVQRQLVIGRRLNQNDDGQLSLLPDAVEIDGELFVQFPVDPHFPGLHLV